MEKLLFFEILPVICKKNAEKILVVDADPQYNSTTYSLDEDTFYDVYYEKSVLIDLFHRLHSTLYIIDKKSEKITFLCLFQPQIPSHFIHDIFQE